MMIRLGTPVRCRDDLNDKWSTEKWFYIGQKKNGWYMVGDENGHAYPWRYVEPLPG